VLRGLAADRLLDPYEEERRPHTVDWTLISIEVGRFTGMTDPIEAAERDRQLKSGVVPPMPTSPVPGSGILQRSAKRHRLVGDLSLQGRVEREGTSICLTIFMTPPASLLSASPEILGHLLIRSSARFLPSSGLALPISVEIASDGDAFDADGTYRKFFDAHGIVALIQRPDLCVFAWIT
jgi:hypothetical protein